MPLDGTVSGGNEPPIVRRAMRSNHPWRAISANTARGRRVSDLARRYLRQCPHLDIDATIYAAEMVEAAEYARAQARRPGVSIAEVDAAARITASADRRLSKLLRTPAPRVAPENDDVVAEAVQQLEKRSGGS